MSNGKDILGTESPFLGGQTIFLNPRRTYSMLLCNSGVPTLVPRNMWSTDRPKEGEDYYAGRA